MDASTPKLLGALLAVKTAVKTTPGKAAWYDIFNPSNATAYVQLFDAALADVTVGTTAPVLSIGIAAGGRASGEAGVGFQTAISAAATTTATGNTAPGTALVANFGIR
jgi:hypothetical protein